MSLQIISSPVVKLSVNEPRNVELDFAKIVEWLMMEFVLS